MKLLLIHGIAQEHETGEGLRSKWLGLLADHAPPADSDRFRFADATMAFYGNELDQWTRGAPPVVSAMGLASAPADAEAEFVLRAMGEIAAANALTAVDIAKAAQNAEAEIGTAAATPMSTAFGRRLVGIVRALESISPWKGGIALHVIRQAYAYLRKPGVGPAIDAIVRPKFGSGKLVVVAHSLGTVIAFKLLRELATEAPDLEIPLLLTLGSPLALSAVKSALGPPRLIPSMATKWINAFDPGDPVTLGKPLDETNFAKGIYNIGDVDNNAFNGHSIDGYLPDPRVIAALSAAI
jgi:hypothetical protein